MLRCYLSPTPNFFSDWLWPYCVWKKNTLYLMLCKTNIYLSFIEEFTMEHFHMLTMRLERSVQANYQCQIWFVIIFASQRRRHLLQKLHNFLDWKLKTNTYIWKNKIIFKKKTFRNYHCQIWFVIIFASQRRRHLL